MVLMFLIHWGYSLLCLAICLGIWFYIGPNTSSSGAGKGIAAEFSIVTYSKNLLARVTGYDSFTYSLSYIYPATNAQIDLIQRQDCCSGGQEVHHQPDPADDARDSLLPPERGEHRLCGQVAVPPGAHRAGVALQRLNLSSTKFIFVISVFCLKSHFIQEMRWSCWKKSRSDLETCTRAVSVVLSVSILSAK